MTSKDSPDGAAKNLGDGVSFTIRSLKESRGEHPRYDIELECPEFLGAHTDLDEINVLEHAACVQRLHDFRSGLLCEHRTPEASDDQDSVSGSSLTSSFEVICFSEHVVSIRHKIFHYGSGAAHPNHSTAVSNYERQPVRSLALRDLFVNGDGHLSALATYCAVELAQQKQLTDPDDWIRRGTAPEESNYSRFNVSREGLVFTFDEYQVGPYVEGEHVLRVPIGVFAEFLRPGTPVTTYLTRQPEADGQSI